MHYIGQLPDLPLPHTSGPRLRTRRKPLAQIVLCQGCCCGQTQRGLPAVPLEWLKPIWKGEKLNKVVQLTVSGCLGPCDLPNVACIVTPHEQAWYGRLTTQEDYAVLLRWARQCRDKGEPQPLPEELAHLRFERWPGADAAEPFTPIAQDPADIILLTAADTEVLTWSHALAQLPDGFPAVRALNLDRLRDGRVFDAYLDDVVQESRVIVARVLGGLGYWREQLEALRLLALAHDIALICVPGDAQPDPDLAALCTVPLSIADTVWRCCLHGGVRNANRMLRLLSDTLLQTNFGHEPPEPVPEIGIYHPDVAEVLDLDAWQSRYFDPRRPTAGLAFYRSHWVTGNLAPIDTLIRSLEQKGLNVLAVFGPHLAAIRESLFTSISLDILLTTTSFSSLSTEHGPRVTGPLDCPILQAIFCSSSENVWAANIVGLSPRDIAMNVALPEFDGRIITTAVSFKNSAGYDEKLQTEVIRYQPRADRVVHVASLAERWVRLRRLPNEQKKVAILLANYPSKNARVGNAVGLDTPASLLVLLRALRQAGYTVGPELPTDGQALIESLIAVSTHDAEFATPTAFTRSQGWVTREQLSAWLSDCPSVATEGIRARWGDVEQSPFFLDGGLPIPGLLLGNIFIGIQPSRGYDQDASAVYHSPDLPPPPYYLAFYRWLRDIFQADAVIHLGKHGNLEWLPGKGSALSANCYPEVMLRDLPHIYPFIINNPGEGTQAKRRSAAVIVDHMIPPMTQAGTYGELRQLENLLDEYYQVQSLDPSKCPLIVEQIGQLVEQAQLYRDFERDQAPTVDEWPTFLNRLDGYLCELKEAQIRDGLHILGQLPNGDQLIDLLLSLVQVDNGAVPGLARALAADLGLDYAALRHDPAVPFTASLSWWDHPCRTQGDVLAALTQLGRRLIARCWKSQSVEKTLANFQAERSALFPHAQQTLTYLWHTIWPRLQLCHQEIDYILAALAGGFVPPGGSGAPTRGRADVLPTGRNFHSLDVRAVPSPTAWKVGGAAASALLERHRERSGIYPESVAVVVWGTSNMRTQGDDIAMILYLLGVQPRWDDANRRVVGLQPIPLTELGRPRIDVTIRISGLFRDAFPNLIQLLNEAVNLVARLEEPLEWNYVRAHIARDVALLSSSFPGSAWERTTCEALPHDSGTDNDPQAGEHPAGGACPAVRSQAEPENKKTSLEEAERRARLRIFGSKPGAYGAGLLPLIDGRNWRTVEDLAEVYLTWSSYAYTGTDGDDGREERDAFRLRLSQTQIVAQNQDNREHDIFDSDDYFQFHGGLIAAIRAVTGRTPDAYLGDTSRPDDVRVRTLREEAHRVFRSRVVNPRWLTGVRRHGYKGAVEMAATVDYLFGYDATANVLDDWMYERLAETYLFDAVNRDFLRQSNPWAERGMIERLLEAAQRGLWQHPNPDTLSRLQAAYQGNDLWLENRPGEVPPP
ncbi:MAG: cobaltochelatase subunit CobN [Gemmataceae bacterium]